MINQGKCLAMSAPLRRDEHGRASRDDPKPTPAASPGFDLAWELAAAGPDWQIGDPALIETRGGRRCRNEGRTEQDVFYHGRISIIEPPMSSNFRARPPCP